MKLLLFAHRLEAQAFLDHYPWKALEKDVYQHKDHILSYSGEGVFEAIYHLEKLLKSYDIDHVLHYGLAGALSSSLEKYGIVKIRTAYQQKNAKDMEFQSFSLDESAKYDVVSANDRITDKKDKDYLANFGQIVDRETWGYAFTCRKERIPFEAYKIISDFADQKICSQIKEEAEVFSLKLLEHFNKNTFEKPNEDKQEASLPEGLYFTENLRSDYLKKLSKLQKKWQLSEEKTLKELGLKDILSSEKKAKEKTKSLLDKMNQALDPDFYLYKKELSRHIQGLKKSGIDLYVGKSFEPSEAELKFRFKDKEDYKKKVETIANIENVLPKEWL